MAEGRLGGDGRPRDRYRATGVRGRDGHQHLPAPAFRLVAERRKGTLLSAAQTRAQHYAVGELDAEGMGPCLAMEGAPTESSSRLTSSKFSSRAFGTGRWW